MLALGDERAAPDWTRDAIRYVAAIDNDLLEVEKALSQPAGGATDDIFTAKMFDSYDQLRNEARMQFFLVDNALMRNCRDLLRVQEPLTAIRGRIGP